MRLKKLGAALVVVAALGGVLASSALAAASTEDVKWFTGSGTELTGSETMSAEAVGTGTFTTTVAGVKYRLQSTEVECVECKIENSGGVAIGSGKLKFKNISVVEPAGCSAPAEITTTALSVTADWMSGTTNYIKFVPTKGETTAFATIEVSGCALATTIVPKGSVFVESANATAVQAVFQEVHSSEAINSTAGGSLHVGTENAVLTANAKFAMSGAHSGVTFGTGGGGGGGSECRSEPSVTTESPSSIEAHAAVFHATVNPQGCETTYEFEYAVAGSGLFVGAGGGTLGSGITGEPVSLHVSGLAANTKYEVKAKAHNFKGTKTGSALPFTTPFEPPSVTTKAATGVGKTTAMLNGTVNAHGSATKYFFEYGLKKEEYGSVSSEGSLAAGTENVNVSKEIKGLEPGTTYHFRLVASNSGGTSRGSDETLTTSSLSWTIQSTPNPAGAKSSRLTFGSCTASSACSSVGEYVNSGGTKVALAERWNGTSWTAESPPSPEGATASEMLGVSCASSSSCEAVGLYEAAGVRRSLADLWNGSSWSSQTTASPVGSTSAELSAVSCTSTTACTAVGQYSNGTSILTLAERWNGTSWSVQSTPNPSGATGSSLLGVSCTSSTACTAVGYFFNSEGQRLTLAEFWNGSEWAVQSSPNRTGATLNILLGVSCSSSSACTAVGGDFPSGGGPQETLAERWNGVAWSLQTTANPSGSEASVLHGVSCVSASVCTAAGDWISSKVNVTLGERWNGSVWSLQSTPNPSGATFSALWSVACVSAVECVSPGYYKNESGTELALTEKGS